MSLDQACMGDREGPHPIVGGQVSMSDRTAR